MEPQLQIRPTESEFETQAATWKLVPVWAELLSDVSTPVGLFPTLVGDGPGVLFESVERSERWGRYSFVAGDPAATVIADRDGVRLEGPVRPGFRLDVPEGLAPRQALTVVAEQLRAPREPRLPSLTGGLMGCLSYEAAELLDGHPAPHADKAPCPPIGLMATPSALSKTCANA